MSPYAGARDSHCSNLRRDEAEPALAPRFLRGPLIGQLISPFFLAIARSLRVRPRAVRRGCWSATSATPGSSRNFTQDGLRSATKCLAWFQL